MYSLVINIGRCPHFRLTREPEVVFEYFCCLDEIGFKYSPNVKFSLPWAISILYIHVIIQSYHSKLSFHMKYISLCCMSNVVKCRWQFEICWSVEHRDLVARGDYAVLMIEKRGKSEAWSSLLLKVLCERRWNLVLSWASMIQGERPQSPDRDGVIEYTRSTRRDLYSFVHSSFSRHSSIIALIRKKGLGLLKIIGR